jgi:hypothetical protein
LSGVASNPIAAANTAKRATTIPFQTKRIKSPISLSETRVLKNEAEARFKNSYGVYFLGRGLIILVKRRDTVL